MEGPAEILGQEEYLPGWNVLPSDQDGKGDTQLSVEKTNGVSNDSPLKFQNTLRDDAVEGRPISAIRFHRKFSEVVVTSHDQQRDAKIAASQGTVSIWTIREGNGVLQRSLLARTGITALDLPLISPTLVIAGTTGGSVLLWDTRVKTSLPINCNPKKGTSFDDFHDRQTVTDVNSSSLASQYFVTTSKGGYICKWSLANLDCPIDRSTLQSASGVGELGIESMDLPRSSRLTGNQRSATNRSATMFIGGQCGGVFRVEENGSSWNLCHGHGQHDASVTSVSAHPLGGQNPFLKDVVLSSSRDWTIRLWNMRDDAEATQVQSFDAIAKGVVNDVMWSPQHPTLFCTCDDAGTLSLFDVSGQILPSSADSWDYTPKGSFQRRLISARWSDDSRLLSAGDEDGKLSIWTCKQSITDLPDADFLGQYVRSKVTRNVLATNS